MCVLVRRAMVWEADGSYMYRRVCVSGMADHFAAQRWSMACAGDRMRCVCVCVCVCVQHTYTHKRVRLLCGFSCVQVKYRLLPHTICLCSSSRRLPYSMKKGDSEACITALDALHVNMRYMCDAECITKRVCVCMCVYAFLCKTSLSVE